MRPASGGCSFVLAKLKARASKAKNAQRQAAVGEQFSGRVGFFLSTDDFAVDELRLRQNGVTIIREPEGQPHGRVLLLEDDRGTGGI